jgi:hypothetical protein
MRDQDTIRRFDLLKLSGDDYWTIIKNGCAIAVLAYIVAAMIAQGTSVASWAFVSTPPVLGLLYSLWMIWLANRRLTPTQRERLTRQGDLMADRGRMQAASGKAAADREATLAHMARLRDLITRMIRLDSDQLADRIARLKELYKCLDDRERADRHLMARYDCECDLLTLQIDALDIFPEEAQIALGARLAELEALDAEIEDSQRRRSAETELARFLEGEPA